MLKSHLLLCVLLVCSQLIVSQTTIAVIEFDARGVSSDEVATLTNRFHDELTKTNKYTVVERTKMEEVLKEQGFQQSGCTSDECAVEVGKLIGVQQIVGGSIGKVGNVFSVSARIINVESEQILNVTTNDYEGEIGGLATEVMRQIVHQLTESVAAPIGGLDIEWVSIPAGPYTFGEKDIIRKDINYDFQIMKYEVTHTQYVTYLEEALSNGDITVTTTTIEGYYTGDKYSGAGTYEFLDLDDNDCRIDWDGSSFSIISGYEDHPVVKVTWFGSWAFAEHYDMRLPTEEEWEKAARGNTGYNYPWGDNIDGSRANYLDSGDPWDNGTAPVGTYNGQIIKGFQTTDSSSPFGVYDMAGNVGEWTNNGLWRVSSDCFARGGCWLYGSYVLHSWRRFSYNPTRGMKNIGFRCVWTQDSSTVSINQPELVPEVFALYPNYPNPFNPMTTIRYDLPQRSEVLITIYDILGREIRTLVNDLQDTGNKSVIWDSTDKFGRSVGTGIYLYQIQAGKFTRTWKMLLLR